MTANFKNGVMVPSSLNKHSVRYNMYLQVRHINTIVNKAAVKTAQDLLEPKEETHTPSLMDTDSSLNDTVKTKWRAKSLNTFTKLFQDDKWTNPLFVQRLFSNLMSMIDHWIYKDDFNETKKETLKANLECDEKMLEEVIGCLRDAKRVLRTGKHARDKERSGIKKVVYQAYVSRVNDFKDEDWRPNCDEKYIWNDVVNNYQHVGVSANRWLQTCKLPEDADFKRDMAAGVDKGGTIFLMIYDKYEHQLIRIGLGFGHYCHKIDKEHRELDSKCSKEMQKDTPDMEQIRRWRAQQKNGTNKRLRQRDAMHRMGVLILTSTVSKTDNRRRFELIACPKMPVKAMIRKDKGTRTISSYSSKLLTYMGFGDFDRMLEEKILYCHRKDGKDSITLDQRGEAYTTGTCNCCGLYTPGIGRSKIFICPNRKCKGSMGVIRDGQGAINILSQVLYDKHISQENTPPEEGIEEEDNFLSDDEDMDEDQGDEGSKMDGEATHTQTHTPTQPQHNDENTMMTDNTPSDKLNNLPSSKYTEGLGSGSIT